MLELAAQPCPGAADCSQWPLAPALGASEYSKLPLATEPQRHLGYSKPALAARSLRNLRSELVSEIAARLLAVFYRHQLLLGSTSLRAWTRTGLALVLFIIRIFYLFIFVYYFSQT